MYPKRCPFWVHPLIRQWTSRIIKIGKKYICSSIIVKNKSRAFGSKNVDIFDRSKIVSGCISGFVQCSRKQYNQLDNK